jgi:hexosaminidase
MDESISRYMAEHDITEYPDLLSLYGQRSDAISLALGATPIHWEDTFMAGDRPAKEVIFDVWTDSTNIGLVTDAGYKVIAAPQNYWYLDHCDNTWQKMYSYDPTYNLTSSQADLIIGGEASMWGEKVDQTNIQTKIWPTAAAVGEKLWSSFKDTQIPAEDANLSLPDQTLRLHAFRCRMVARGFFAGPINPGYCEVEYV